MELTVKRKDFTENSTIGELSVNGEFFCYVLEDKDRGLKDSDSLLWIKAKKIYGKTAIPKGRYEVVLSMSARFKKYMPLLINVKGFEGIRIHSGNTAENSLGCLLTGMDKARDFVGKSRIAFDALMVRLMEVEHSEKIFITIQ